MQSASVKDNNLADGLRQTEIAGDCRRYRAAGIDEPDQIVLAHQAMPISSHHNHFQLAQLKRLLADGVQRLIDDGGGGGWV